MAAPRNSPPSDPAGSGDEALRARRAAEDAQMFSGTAGTGGSDEAEGGIHDGGSPAPQDGAPTVGKTSGRGSRAERPSPQSERRQASAPASELDRTAKPPAETPKSEAGADRPSAAER